MNLPPAPPAPSGEHPPIPPTTASNAIAALVLGIAGIILCPICAPIAWKMGGKTEHEIDASEGRLTGRGLATAARILGVIGTALIAIYVLFFVGWIFFIEIMDDHMFGDLQTTSP